ncbi:ribonuclease H-like domain-containing protein [Tanacetum coccineum]
MWLYKHKYNADGFLNQYKARLVANGRSQQQGINYDETFIPVVKPVTIRTVISLVVSQQWPIHQLDVKNAFLHGHLTKTVYMHQPSGFTDSAHSDYGQDTAYLLLYVDDIILTASSTSLLQRIISLLHAEFAMTDLGPLNYFLGISATRTTSGIFLSQTKYATEILEQAQMLNCNPCRTPIDTEKKLGPEGSPVTDPTLYRSLAGSLQYLTFTRPDLSYAVQQLCLYMHDPREPHLNAMKRVLRYLRGTTDLGLQLFRSTTSQLIAYSDADWAGYPATRRSTSGYCVFLAETSWIRNLFRELHTPLFTATLVYCDNVSAVYMSANLVQHQRTKHIEIDIHFVRDKVAAGHVRVLHVPSRFQYADIFIKDLPYPLFADFKSSRDTIQLEDVVSTISEEYLLEFTSEYGIPESLHSELPGPEEPIVEFSESKVGVYTKFFEFTNYRIPISQFLFDILGHYQIHLSQLSVIDMDLFNLISAPNPAKVKTETRPRVAHEVPLLTVTAIRVIDMEDMAVASGSSGTPSALEKLPLDFANEDPPRMITDMGGTKDQVQEGMSYEIPPVETATTMEVVQGLEKEVAAMGPPVNKRRRKRGNDGAEANVPPKVLMKDHAAFLPAQSTLGGKCLTLMGLEAGSTFFTPASQETSADAKSVSDPEPLSFSKPQPHLERDVAQSSWKMTPEIPTENIAARSILHG